MTDPKPYKLEISGPGFTPRLPVRTQTGTKISRLEPATETKSDRFEFILSGRSHVNVKEEIYGGRYELTPV